MNSATITSIGINYRICSHIRYDRSDGDSICNTT